MLDLAFDFFDSAGQRERFLGALAQHMKREAFRAAPTDAWHCSEGVDESSY